ncbi:MAG: DUF3887 domain-containing protein [bacterium]
MKTYILLISVLVLTISFISCGEKKDGPEVGDLTPLATGFVELLVKEDFANAAKNFDNTMKGVMPEAKLQEAWQGLLAQSGSFKKQTGVRQTQEQGFNIVLVTCEFEKSTLNIKVVFNNANEISGLWFVP